MTTQEFQPSAHFETYLKIAQQDPQAAALLVVAFAIATVGAQIVQQLDTIAGHIESKI